MPALEVLAMMRTVVSNDPYASTFQSFGQYRTALLRHIDNLGAAVACATKNEKELAMNQAEYKMPLAAIAYPPEHPFPLAVRRVAMLERAMSSGVIVQLDALATYTATAHGGMRLDPQGPWVTKLEVMGHSRSAHPDGEALAIFTALMHERLVKAHKAGKSGWDDPAECTVASLARLLILNVASGDYVSVANYAMMLEQRTAEPEVLLDALAHFVQSEICGQPHSRDAAETFAQALIAKGWHNDDPACVDGVDALLVDYCAIHGNPVVKS